MIITRAWNLHEIQAAFYCMFFQYWISFQNCSTCHQEMQLQHTTSIDIRSSFSYEHRERRTISEKLVWIFHIPYELCSLVSHTRAVRKSQAFCYKLIKHFLFMQSDDLKCSKKLCRPEKAKHINTKKSIQRPSAFAYSVK